MYVIRNEMFRINAGRGNQIADETPLDSFVFVPTSKAAVSFLTLHRHFTMDKARIQSKSKELADVLSKLGKSSMLFTGRQVYKGKSSSSSSSSSSSPPSSSSSSSSSLSNNNDLNLLKRTADDYCDLTHCTYTLSLPWGDKMRPITYHNMHLGLALEDSEFPLHTLVSDFITTLVSLFRNARRVEVLVVVVDQSVGEMGMLVNAIDLALDIVAEEGDRTRPHVYKIEM